MHLAEIYLIYQGSDGVSTKALYDKLDALGPAGEIATNLFRAHKSSERAKGYRGRAPGRGSYRGLAYGRKQWAMDNLCKILQAHGEALGIVWGWGVDTKQSYHSDVLYVDIPTGQVSFHTAGRGDGPDYPRGWDGQRNAGAQRVCTWCAQLLGKGPRSTGPSGGEGTPNGGPSETTNDQAPLEFDFDA